MTAAHVKARREGQDVLLRIDDVDVRVSNLDKVLWPEPGFTKRDMIAYYIAIAPVLLPHLRDRPMVTKRYPDGVEGLYWYQTRCPHPPAWMKTHPIPAASKPSVAYDYCVVDDVASLVWVANTGAIELHPLAARIADLQRPCWIVFDLDPSPPANVLDCCRVALALRDHLDRVGLASLPKSSGLAGLHVYAPLDTRLTFGEAKAFGRELARVIVAEDPDRTTATKVRAERHAKVLIDWSQNSALRSVVAPYSLRAARAPSVSAPLTWSEVETALAQTSDAGLRFTAPEILARIEDKGDLFESLLAPR